MYKYLQESGYILIFKPTLKFKRDGKEITKGNVDTELVLHAAAIEYNNYDKGVIISGDGDFHCLYDYLISKDKLLKVLVPNKYQYSSLLNKFIGYLDFVSQQQKKLERTKERV